MRTAEANTWRSSERLASSDAFTLSEVIVALLLAGGVLFMGINLILAGKRLLPGREIEVGSSILPLAPSPAAFSEAVKIHSILMERTMDARAIYVFGGQHEGLPEGALRRSGRPLAAQALPQLTVGLEQLHADAFGFHRAHEDVLGPMQADAGPEDFSVIVVGPRNGTLQVTALVQVRSVPVGADDSGIGEELVRRDTILFDVSGDRWTCSFVERAVAASAARVGARHHWYRYDEGRVAEEGPALIVFPDPWLHAGHTSNQNVETPLFTIPAFSRFVYLLAVSP